jgi:hypothetical protein
LSRSSSPMRSVPRSNGGRAGQKSAQALALRCRIVLACAEGGHNTEVAARLGVNRTIDHWNDDPKPFVWHKSADEILGTLAAYCARISDSGH